MRVLVPAALLSYTGDSWVEAEGATVADALADLDARYPGIRFRMIDEQGRIRRHMRMIVRDISLYVQHINYFDFNRCLIY